MKKNFLKKGVKSTLGKVRDRVYKHSAFTGEKNNSSSFGIDRVHYKGLKERFLIENRKLFTSYNAKGEPYDWDSCWLNKVCPNCKEKLVEVSGMYVCSSHGGRMFSVLMRTWQQRHDRIVTMGIVDKEKPMISVSLED